MYIGERLYEKKDRLCAFACEKDQTRTGARREVTYVQERDAQRFHTCV